MADLFAQFSPIRPEYKSNKGEALMAYEEHFMKLVRNYKPEIEDIENMMEQIRQERYTFYKTKLPEIERYITNDNVLSEEAKQEWITELRSNIEKSFTISESLISHYVTSNIEEFKAKMKEEMDKV